MQNPPILTVTGPRRPHDRAHISLPHGIAILAFFGTFEHICLICEKNRDPCNWRKRFGVCGARNRQTRGTPPARSRPACGLPLGARVVFRVCSGVARSEAFRLKSGLFINNRQTIRKPFEC